MAPRERQITREVSASGSESLTTLIVKAVGACSNETASELPPLFEVVDPDALEALFSPSRGSNPPSTVTVEFEYAGYEITVSADRTITIVEPAEPTE